MASKGSDRPKKRKGGQRKSKAGKKKRDQRRGILDYGLMQALRGPQRVRIFSILCERTASPNEIAVELGENLSKVAYHVKVLYRCGLVKLERNVQVRGAVEHFYRAVTPTLIPPGAWDHLPAPVRKHISMEILQEFHEDASGSIEAGLFDDAPGELNWTPLILDEPGLEELGRLSREFLEKTLELQANASKRLRRKGKGAKRISATAFLASFLSARSPEEGKNASATRRR